MDADRPTCATCRWYQDEGGFGAGTCHVRSAALTEARRERIDGGAAVMEWADRVIHVFPRRSTHDWCGEHEPQRAEASAEHSHDMPSRHEPDPEREADAVAEAKDATIDALRDLDRVTAERDRYKAALEMARDGLREAGALLTIERGIEDALESPNA